MLDPADAAAGGYRGFSCQLTGRLIDALDQVRVPSKSELQRFAHGLPEERIREVIDGLLQGAIQKPKKLGLKEASKGKKILQSLTLIGSILNRGCKPGGARASRCPPNVDHICTLVARAPSSLPGRLTKIISFFGRHRSQVILIPR